jgi:aminoglycoside phosphotransferase (APT) family kinase protein
MAAYGDGRRVHLHGDLFSGNVAFDARDGGLRVIDSCAYLGPPEFDAARWCARVGRAGAVQRLAEGWAEVERLDGPLLQRLLGLELLMEAGVRELVKIENGLPWDARDAETVALLAAATATGS